jgi:hypothetical protein
MIAKATNTIIDKPAKRGWCDLGKQQAEKTEYPDRRGLKSAENYNWLPIERIGVGIFA